MSLHQFIAEIELVIQLILPFVLFTLQMLLYVILSFFLQFGIIPWKLFHILLHFFYLTDHVSLIVLVSSRLLGKYLICLLNITKCFRRIDWLVDIGMVLLHEIQVCNSDICRCCVCWHIQNLIVTLSRLEICRKMT
jgi:hypothetical protein